MKASSFKVQASVGFLVLAHVLSVLGAPAQEWPIHPSAALQTRLEAAVRSTLREFEARTLAADQLAATLVDLTDPAAPARASVRGQAPIYPASVVKLFYLEAAHRWMEEGKILDTPELRRALRDMIVDSSNEATHYIVDLLTGTTSGPELPPAEMDVWVNKRNVVNRYFASRSYAGINVNQKPWCEGPYGRERIFVGPDYTNRNALTTDATARLLAEIVTGQAVSPGRSAEMRQLLERDPFPKQGEANSQARGFTGAALSPGMKLWSKAGWTNQTRHDAACIETPQGARFVLVIFTVGHANEPGIITALARSVLEGFAPKE